MADHLVSGAAGRAARDPDRLDPGAVARDRRDRAAHHDRRAHVGPVRARQHLVAVHGAPDPGVQLGVAAPSRLRAECRRGYHRAARDAADHERRGDCRARSLSEEANVMATTPVRRPLAGLPKADGLPAQERTLKIDVAGLNFYYGEKQALAEISIGIDANIVTAFIGPSGCGKSTFLRTLNRMNDIIGDTRVEGQVRIDGQNIYAPGTDVVGLRRKVGMVFQKSNPFPKTIFENVA